MALITPDKDLISGPLLDLRAAFDTINLHIPLGSPDMLIGMKLVEDILMMRTPSCMRLEECAPSTDACWHHLHVVEEEPPAIVLLCCDEDISVQLENQPAGRLPIYTGWIFISLHFGKPWRSHKEARRCRKMWEMSDLWILHNLFSKRGKIISGALGNLGNDKDCENLVI